MTENKNMIFMVGEDTLLMQISGKTFFFSDDNGCLGAFRVTKNKDGDSNFENMTENDFKIVKAAVNDPKNKCKAYESLDYKEKDVLENSKEIVLETINFYEKMLINKKTQTNTCAELLKNLSHVK